MPAAAGREAEEAMTRVARGSCEGAPSGATRLVLEQAER
jgi:hypothetical protein